MMKRHSVTVGVISEGANGSGFNQRLESTNASMQPHKIFSVNLEGFDSVRPIRLYSHEPIKSFIVRSYSHERFIVHLVDISKRRRQQSCLIISVIRSGIRPQKRPIKVKKKTIVCYRINLKK